MVQVLPVPALASIRWLPQRGKLVAFRSWAGGLVEGFTLVFSGVFMAGPPVRVLREHRARPRPG